MNVYQSNVAIVLEYLSGNGGDKSVSYSLSHSCFNQLARYLSANGLRYSKTNADKWINLQSRSPKTLMGYRKALRQLDDVYKTGHVCFKNRGRLCLPQEFQDIITDYISAVSAQYKDSHLMNIENRCRFFLGFLHMDRSVSALSDIVYPDIISFYFYAKSELCKADFSMYKGTIKAFLTWISERHLCPEGFSTLLYMNNVEKASWIGDFSMEVEAEIRNLSGHTNVTLSPAEFLKVSLEFRKNLETFGYADTMMYTCDSVLSLLYLFLDMNGIGYVPGIARLWFKETGLRCFGTNSMMARRIIMLFEVFSVEGRIHPDCFFLYKPLTCDALPEWCRNVLSEFLAEKRKEDKADSTVDMYRSAITRFCLFLEKEGLESFHQVDGEIIKKFNLEDPHETAEGKNAYNVRIRKFLLYLAINGYTDNFFLGEALPCTAAPKTRVVTILNQDETEMLEEYSEDDKALALRNRAIVLLGLKMGFRASDITNLKLEQVDWRNQCLRLRQKKTAVEKTFPMPVDVGNAIYLYLTEGRPESDCAYIFITHKAPYCKVGRSVCERIMKIALPDRHGRQFGFHITRRTYATQRFRNDCTYSDVADLLGHTTTDTVMKYISLDDERMKSCPISLYESGISMEGGFCL